MRSVVLKALTLRANIVIDWISSETNGPFKRPQMLRSSDQSSIELLGSSPILVGSFENAVDSVSFWDERINHRTLSRITGS
jgi:hypothetical protein